MITGLRKLRDRLKLTRFRWRETLRKTRKAPLYGIERAFAVGLVALRVLSISFWVRRALGDPAYGEDRQPRDRAVEVYIILQLLVLAFLAGFPGRNLLGVGSIIALYVLFEIFLSLFNIVFIGKLPDVNAPTPSAERSLLLLLLNAVQLPLIFAIFYRCRLGLGPAEAIVNSVLVFGTVGHPIKDDGRAGWIVAGQIFTDLVFVLLFLGAFAGRSSALGRIGALSKHDREPE